VLGQRLDMTKPLWEAWLVEGLEEGRWALISKVHHSMVDGIAGTDLMQLIFDVDPDAEHSDPQPWTPEPEPSTGDVLAAGIEDAIAKPARHLQHLLDEIGTAGFQQVPRLLLQRGAVLTAAAPGFARQVVRPVARSLNGPIGPHRRWAWADTSIDEIKRVRRGLGGTVNDVVLTAISRGFRDLLESRGELADGLVVRTMVPVSVRRPDERGSLNNQVSAVFVDLPVGEPDAAARLASVRGQMDEYKQVLNAVPARGIVAMGDFVAPTLLALGTRAAARARQPFTQAVTTNVPGPRVPLYVLGRRMRSLYAYVPIAAGLRISIGIYSYLGAVTFGINADFDAFPDLQVLSDGIARGMTELLEVAEGIAAGGQDQGVGQEQEQEAAAGKATRSRRNPPKRSASR
jgi:WS/DGAT/MGAT family acyltransferase